jgi:16S rRNA U516 pseudouridylate synthase RsuA-like enzyme
MREGRKRQIRRTGRTLGLHVKRILRVRLSTLRLGTLKPGQWRKLTDREIRQLYRNHSQSHRKSSHRRNK